MTGMKGGTGGDPFENYDPDEPEPADEVEEPEPEDTEDSGSDGVPWAFERNSVKSDRELVQFFLQETTEEREKEFEREVEDIAGFDFYKTDFREAAYLVAMEHPEEVVEILEEWGCEHA